MMNRYEFKYVLKLISKERIDFKSVKKYFDNSQNNEMHYYSINKNESGDFNWNTVINIVISDDSWELNQIREKGLYVKKDFLTYLNLNDNEIDSQLYKQFYFGDELDNKYLVISFYSINKEISKIRREKNMMEHFDMERNQKLYKLVHFNQIIDENKFNQDFQFVFESYMEDSNDINNLYSQEFINIMREHSKGFLDVSTRKLAFGEVRILKKNK